MLNHGDQCINAIMGSHTSPLIVADNLCLFQRYRSLLARKIISLFDIKAPDKWPELTMWWLILLGWFAVVEDHQFGVIPSPGTLSGAGIWNEPTEVLIAQPLLTAPKYNRPLRIGKDVSVIRMSPDYVGARQIINHYAELLTLCDNAIHANLLNSRIGHVFSANNAGIAKAIKTVYHQIACGEPAVVDSKVKLGSDSESFRMFGEPGKHVITDKLLENRRVIYRDFCRDVGIQTGTEDKRERMTETEVEIGNNETERMVTYWLRYMRTSARRTNEMFPNLNLEVEFHGNYNSWDSSAPSDAPAQL